MTDDVRPIGLLLAFLVLVAATTDAREPKRIVLKTPTVSLPAASNLEICYFTRIPATTPFEMVSWQLINKGSKGSTQSQHSLVYLYAGERGADFPAGELVQSRGCLDLGPDDRDRRVLIASSTAPKVVRALPAGVALGLVPVPDAPGGAPAAIGLLIDVNWSNGDSRTRKVSTKVVLRRVGKNGAKRVAHPLVDRSADAGILVPPFTRHSTAELVDARWTPSTDSCVLGLTTQMHRRGKCAGVDQLDVGGQVKPPPSGLPNPCEADQRRQLFVAADWTDPGALAFTAPLPVRAGESLRYACWVDNGSGAGTAVRLGCEETPGVIPGSVDHPAAQCSVAVPASAECPGNAACTFANAVAGAQPADELCGLTAFVYDAAPGGSCDVSSAP